MPASILKVRNYIVNIKHKVIEPIYVIILSLNIYLSTYYLGSYSPITFSWRRATITYIIGAPILFDVVIDVTVIAVLSLLIIFLNIDDLLGRLIFSVSTVTLTLTGYVLYSAIHVRSYLTLVGLAGIISIVPLFVKGRLRYLLLSITTLLMSISIITIIVSTLYALRLIPDDVASNVILTYWRGFWRFAEIPLNFLVVSVGVYWLIAYFLRFKPAYAERFIEVCKHKSKVLSNRSLLIISLIIPSIIIILLHLPTFNPRFAPISVDTFYYARELSNAKSFLDIIQGFRGTRPIYMILIYSLYVIVKDPILLMDFIHPLIVLTLQVYAVYRLMNRICPEIAGLAALLTAIGPNTLTFIAGGFQANSLALAIALLALSVRSDIIRFFLLITTAFIHPWTFAMYTTAYFLWLIVSRRGVKLGLILAGSAVLAMVTLTLIDMLLGLKGPYEYMYLLLVKNIALNQVPGYQLIYAVDIVTWGSLKNIPLYLLIPASYISSPLHLLLAIVSPALFIFKKTIVHRLLLNIPLGIIASYPLSIINSRVRLALVVAIAAYTLSNAVALTPLTTPPWTNIFSLEK